MIYIRSQMIIFENLISNAINSNYYQNYTMRSANRKYKVHEKQKQNSSRAHNQSIRLPCTSRKKGIISCQLILAGLKIRQPPYSNLLCEHQAALPKSTQRRRINKKPVLLHPHHPYSPSSSRSYIVFSDKGSSLNGTGLQFGPCKTIAMTQSYAATLIQKVWRGYLTRKLLQEYIQEEEIALKGFSRRGQGSSAGKYFQDQSKELCIDKRNLTRISCSIQNQEQLSSLSYSKHNTQKKHQTPKIKENTQIFEQISKFQRSQPKFRSISPRKMSLNSSIFSYSVHIPKQQQPLILQSITDQLHEYIRREACLAKQQLSLNKADMQQIVTGSRNIKKIVELADQFINDVSAEIQGYVNQICSISLSNNQIKVKSECFVIQNDTNQEFQFNKRQEANDQPLSQQFEVLIQQDNESKTQFKKQIASSEFMNLHSGHRTLLSFLTTLTSLHQPQTSELTYLCQTLKTPPTSLSDRCLLQFTVDLVTSGISMYEALEVLEGREASEQAMNLVSKWIGQMSKWEMEVIQEVTGRLQCSEITNINTTFFEGEAHTVVDE